MSSRQDLIDESERIMLASGLTQVEVDELPIHSWRTQDHAEIVQWDTGGRRLGSRPSFALTKRPAGQHKPRRGAR